MNNNNYKYITTNDDYYNNYENYIKIMEYTPYIIIIGTIINIIVIITVVISIIKTSRNTTKINKKMDKILENMEKNKYLDN